MRKTFFYIMLPILFSGCATYRARPIAPQQTADAFRARTLTDPGLQRFMGLPPTAWDLDRLTQVALYYHPDLDVARAQWETAKAGQRTAGERPVPSINLGPTWVSNPDAGLTPWILGFNFDIPIETAGKRGIRKREAAAVAEAARQNLAQTAWQLRSQVRSRFVALIAAQDAEAILRHQQKELDENARLLQDRSSTGRTSPLNAAQASLLLGHNQIALEEASRQQSDARAALADALGLPIAALQNIVLSTETVSVFPSAQDDIVTKARQAALLNRPDLLALLATYAASEAALELEVAKQYPDIHLGPGFTYDQGQNKWGLGVAFPIMSLKGPIYEAEARRQEVAARFLALQDTAINQIDRSLTAYQAAYHTWQTANAIFQTQDKQNRRLKNLLKPGDVSRLTLFRSQLDIDSTALARTDAFRQAQEALGALEDAFGRPLTGALRLSADKIEKPPRDPISSSPAGSSGGSRPLSKREMDSPLTTAGNDGWGGH